MATRSLTEVFILMRNNAMQNRHLFSEQVSKALLAATTPDTPSASEVMADDRTALVGRDAEMGIIGRNSGLPPEWIDRVEEVQYEISRIKQKMKELAVLYDKHSNRPTLDDSINEEHELEIQTQEVTNMFMRCQRLVHEIQSASRLSTLQEQKLTNNISSSLARTVKELSLTFRKSQSSYLKKLHTREERARQYFDTDLQGLGQQDDELDELFDRGFSQRQLQIAEDNTRVVEQREKEINQVLRSIHDLNDIFKDLATMIVDQGTILDRIDYNIEQTAERVEKGLGHLQKAEKYQKKNRKMLCILILCVILIIMIIILIAIKS